MNRYKNIQDELNELKSSLKAGVKPVFNLPEGYFENFPSTVMEKIHSAETEAKAEIGALSPLLASMSRNMPMSVPDNYFEHLSAVPHESGKVLETISRSMPYEVPAHYFEDLPDAIQARVWKPKAKVVPFRRRVMQLAAAAIITGVVAISGWVYFNQKSNNAISVNEPAQWVSTKLNGVTNQELDEFINTTSAGVASEPIAAGGKPEIRKMLTDVSDSELDNFLAGMPKDEVLTYN